MDNKRITLSEIFTKQQISLILAFEYLFKMDIQFVLQAFFICVRLYI